MTPPPISVEESVIAGDTVGAPGQAPGAGQPVEPVESPVPAMAHELLNNPLLQSMAQEVLTNPSLQKPAPTEEPKVTSVPVTNTPEKAEAVAFQAQRDQAYHERNELVALLARMFPSGYRETNIPGWDPEWRYCIFIDLPAGQCSWHIHEREKDLLAGLPLYKPNWDGHTSDMKYARIREFWQIWLAPPTLATPLAPPHAVGGMRSSAEMRGLASPIQNPDGTLGASHYPHEIPSGSLSAELGNQELTGYAIVELFGHMKIAGKISERTIAGEGFLQLDIEQEDGSSFTRLIHPKSIYALNPVAREVALELATRWQYAPVKPYDVPKLQEAFRKEQAEDQRVEDPDQFDPA